MKTLTIFQTTSCYITLGKNPDGFVMIVEDYKYTQSIATVFLSPEELTQLLSKLLQFTCDQTTTRRGRGPNKEQTKHDKLLQFLQTNKHTWVTKDQLAAAVYPQYLTTVSGDDIIRCQRNIGGLLEQLSRKGIKWQYIRKLGFKLAE